MCGICGKLEFDRDARVSDPLIRIMLDTIRHRGPDDQGVYISRQVGLGHARLSIIDLNGGHQPLSNENGTIWIVFNGEIYNFHELRTFLSGKGHVFKTRSDTEVIVHLYEEFGHDCVEKLRGMFAFAIWDERKESLFLARDRVGIKPLYYWLSDKSLIFASEIKAILADPEAQPEVVPGMIDRFLTFSFVPGEETLLRNIYKLAPGAYMVVQKGKTRIKQYWDLRFDPTECSVQDAQTKLLTLLDECVRLHMISDVPVGFLLSGGIDSTAMLGMAVGKINHDLRSFTIGFSAPGLADERPYARLAASRYGSEHHEMTISAKEFADFLPMFAWYMEEPVCEPQAVALYYVTRLARDFVKVLISGEGGDEAFAGYSIYRNMLWIERFKSLLGSLNRPLSSALSRLNRLWPTRRVAKYGPLIDRPIESYYHGRTSSLGRSFNSNTGALYSADFSHYVDRTFSTTAVTRYLNDGSDKGKLNRMLYVDTKTSLPDDLLLKADRMTMANSVELRVPFLDHKFLEFAASLPESLKVRGMTTKYVLKKALRDLVPQEILQRKKAGFPVPYEAWMRTELKDWVRSVLLDGETLSRGYFNRSSLEQLIDEDIRFHTCPTEIFCLVSLELWHRAFLDRPKGTTAGDRVPLAVRS
jgi:asparagine synthase (glutamine-hydrolysing)